MRERSPAWDILPAAVIVVPLGNPVPVFIPPVKVASASKTRIGGTLSTVKHFRSKIRNLSGNTPKTLSEQIF